MTHSPQFSIIIPCYNAAATLPQTLASLRAQTVTDWEALLIDDGSQDDTPALIAAEALADPRLRLLANPRKGPSAARNHGATQARGAVLAFCDADDLWAPDKLDRMVAEFAAADTDAVYARIGFFRDSPEDSRVQSTVPPGPLGIATLLGENPVCTMSNLCIRSAGFAASGGFDETLVHNEDLEWLIRLAGQGARIIGHDETLVWYRSNAFGLSADFAAMRAGRTRALETAQRFGHAPDQRAEAIYLRYLARRALRLDAGRLTALRFVIEGLRNSPAGFFSDLRRGTLTALGAVVAPLLSLDARRHLFGR